MKKDFAKWKLLIGVIIAFLVISLSANTVYASALRMVQPVYGMHFYVHQPRGIPANWYTTFDGFPVWRGSGGVWFYGSYYNRRLIRTNYVVGAITPSLMGIFPYVTQTNVIVTPPPVIITPPPVVIAPTPVMITHPVHVPVYFPVHVPVVVPCPVGFTVRW